MTTQESTPDLAAGIVDEAEKLVRLEIELAKQELKEMAITNAIAAGSFAVAALLALLALLVGIPVMIVVAVERGKRAALIAAGVGAGIAVVAVGAFLVYRMTRPPSTRERVERVIPSSWWERLTHLRRTVEEGFRRRVPPVRMYVGDRQVGEEPPSSSFQKLALRFAQAAGTAAGAALISRVLRRFERAA